MANMGFGATLAQLWATLITILQGVESFAKGFKNMGDWTNESTATFVDESRIVRKKKLAALEAELAVEQAQAKATTAAAIGTSAPATNP
jgi:hypothetical protein